MKARELRIGNYVNSKGRFDIVTRLEYVVFEDVAMCWGQYYEQIIPEPIPLTEEWLLKFGFKKPAHIWCGDKFHLTNYDRDHSLWCVAMNKNNAIIANIRYLHQLQNLYFALTGEELTLNEKQDA